MEPQNGRGMKDKPPSQQHIKLLTESLTVPVEFFKISMIMHNEFFALSKLLYDLDKWGHVPLKHGVRNIYVSGSDGHQSAIE